MDIDPQVTNLIECARVARLATVDTNSKPHLVPVVFVFDGERFVIPIDKKRKTVPPEKLKRVMNIKQNPNVILLIDEYDEDWTKLVYVMIQGKAFVLNRLEEGNSWLQQVYEKMIVKYPQYQDIGLEDTCIMLKPEKAISWQNSQS
jgi:PPOX class probable F420-dependent enzyme